MEFIGFAILIALGMLLLVFKLGVLKVLGYDFWFDLIITTTLMGSLAGTFAGMTVALLAGLIVSIVLMALKKLIGYEKLERRTDISGVKRWRWVQYKGSLDL